MLLSFFKNNWKLICICVAFLGLFTAYKIEQSRADKYKEELVLCKEQVQALGNSLALQNSAVKALKDKSDSVQADLQKARTELIKKQSSVQKALESTKGKKPSSCSTARPDVNKILDAIKQVQ